MIKRILFPFLTLLLLIPSSLSAKESVSTSEIVRLTRYVGEEITGVAAGYVFRVELVADQETKAVVEIPVALEKYLVFEKQNNGVVRVDMRVPNHSSRQKRREYEEYIQNNQLVLKLHTPVLNYIHLTMAAKATAMGEFTSEKTEIRMESATKLDGLHVSTQKLSLRLSGATHANIMSSAISADIRIDGAGKLFMELLNNEDTQIDAGSAANVKLSGWQAEDLTINASSAAKVNTQEFRAKNVDINASSAANVTAYASEYIKIRTTSAAKVQYAGNPQKRDIGHPNIAPIR